MGISWKENLRTAFAALRTHKLRAALTMLGVVIEHLLCTSPPLEDADLMRRVRALVSAPRCNGLPPLPDPQ